MEREISYESYREAHLERTVAFCRELSWASYSDAGMVRRAFLAPGAVTWVARHGDRIIGLVHLMTDGLVQAHLSLVGVHPQFRRQGIGEQLIREAFQVCGAKWLDLAAEDGSEDFYRTFVHKERIGFRLYPGESCD